MPRTVVVLLRLGVVGDDVRAVVRRLRDVYRTVVHRTRVQRSRSVFYDEGPGRKQRGDRATTRAPTHFEMP